MANHPSAEKRQRQNEKRRIANKGVRSDVRTQVKKVLQAVDDKDPEVGKVLSQAAKHINKASSKGIIKKKTASRKISRLAKKANSAAS